MWNWRNELYLLLATDLAQLTGSLYWWGKAKGLTALKIHILREREKMTRQLWLSVQFERDWRCVYCGVRNYKNQDGWKPNMEVDHIRPLFHYGTSARSNLQVLCKPCNQKKGTKLPT